MMAATAELTSTVCAGRPAASDSDQFLSWFAGLGIPMIESRLRLGGLEYFHFSSLVPLIDGRQAGAFGSSTARKLAALKCAGESIERQAMVEFFHTRQDDFPRVLRNSNGWAVHTSRESARSRALDEALERHLLLKSFFLFGWNGFDFHQDIQCGEMKLKLLTSRFVASGKVAGLVAAQSPEYPGVSFGYTLGSAAQIDQAAFWQSAIFEAVDKFLMLAGREASNSPDDSWIRREVARLINRPIDMNLLGVGSREQVVDDVGAIEVHELDLGSAKGLEFPLHAAFARGDGLIPLFWKSELCPSATAYLEKILANNGITAIPDWHPVL